MPLFNNILHQYIVIPLSQCTCMQLHVYMLSVVSTYISRDHVTRLLAFLPGHTITPPEEQSLLLTIQTMTLQITLTFYFYENFQ